MSKSDDLELITDAARRAGGIALGFFGASNKVWHKEGHSPVSEADYAVDEFLRKTLTAARPGYGWLSEETDDNSDRLMAERVFIVDPIDGTRGFLDGRQEWCISVAIVERGRPVAGVLECPATEETFSAAAGMGAFLNGDRLLKLDGSHVATVTASKKLNDAIRDRFGARLSILPFIPSLAYRIAMVAACKVDAAFARPGASDWDIAAADLILSETGGQMVDLAGRQQEYNLVSTRRGSLIASGEERIPGLLDLAKQGGFLH